MTKTHTSVDLNDPENLERWCQTWGVTVIQLKIAVGRVGTDPSSVMAEINSVLKQSSLK